MYLFLSLHWSPPRSLPLASPKLEPLYPEGGGRGKAAVGSHSMSSLPSGYMGQAKAVRADMAAGGPEARAREAAEKEARYAAFLKSRTAADLARSDETNRAALFH